MVTVSITPGSVSEQFSSSVDVLGTDREEQDGASTPGHAYAKKPASRNMILNYTDVSLASMQLAPLSLPETHWSIIFIAPFRFPSCTLDVDSTPPILNVPISDRIVCWPRSSSSSESKIYLNFTQNSLSEKHCFFSDETDLGWAEIHKSFEFHS